MFDFKTLLGWSILIFSIGFFLRSFMPAYALNGPSTGLGANPVASWAGKAPSNGWISLGTMSGDFLITDIYVSGQCYVAFANQNTNANSSIYFGGWARYSSTYGFVPIEHNFTSGILVEAGETLYLYADTNTYCRYNVSGYYTH